MRTHAQIIKDAGATLVHERLEVSLNTVRSWAQRGSIPAEHWKALDDLGVATLDELAEAAAAKREPPSEEAAA